MPNIAAVQRFLRDWRHLGIAFIFSAFCVQTGCSQTVTVVADNADGGDTTQTDCPAICGKATECFTPTCTTFVDKVICQGQTERENQVCGLGAGFCHAGLCVKDAAADAQGLEDTSADAALADLGPEPADVPAAAKDVPKVDIAPPDVKKQPKCIDEDGDGFGTNCGIGKEDCDDLNPNFNTICPDCSKGNVPGCNCSGKSIGCFTGDPAWEGKGVCAAGVQACVAGFWDECKGQILPGLEVCDGQDNDCDGLTDEGVKSKCDNCDLSCYLQKVGPNCGADYAFELSDQNSIGVGLDKNGNITLDPSQFSLELKFLWVANTSDNTVSKIDAKTVTEVGRYAVCGSPSRIAVDLDGNAWVGCQTDGGVAKIMAEKKNCVDKNGDGIIQTSTNFQTNCATAGCDECVKFIVYPEGKLSDPGVRGMAIDKFNHAWVGFFDAAKVDRLAPEDGKKEDQIDLKGCAPRGLVIDQKGVLWAQSLGCTSLVRIDVNSKQVSKYKPVNGGYGAQGITVDKFERIWLGGTWIIGGQSGGAARFDPVANEWAVATGSDSSIGVASSSDGFVYIANDLKNTVGKIDALTTKYVGPISILGGILGKQNREPHGVAVDYDGYVWTSNFASNTVGKVDPKAIILVGEIKVGQSPDTSGDATGYTMNYFTAPKGQYVATFFGGDASAYKAKAIVGWQSISVDAELPQGTSLKMRLRSADDAGALVNAVWSDGVDFPPNVFPYDLTNGGLKVTGFLLQVELTLSTKDKKVSPLVKCVTAQAKYY